MVYVSTLTLPAPASCSAVMTRPTKSVVCSRPMSMVQPSGGGRSGLRSTSMTTKRQAALNGTRSAANVSASE